MARAGLYPESIRAEISTERLQRYFTHEEGGYRVIKSIREMCIFARQNLLADPPFSRLDMVSCRNVLIYLSTETQSRLIPLFHYALKPQGCLLLGSAETIGSYTDLFSPLDKQMRIYTRKQTATRDLPFPRPLVSPFRKPNALERTAGPAHRNEMELEADRILLQRYAPGSVLINGDLDVLHFKGRTSPWLEPPHGEARLNIAHMARQSLFLEVRQGVLEARETSRRVRKENIAGSDTGERVNLEIVPIRPRGQGGESFLVIFEPVEGSRPPQPIQPAAVSPDDEVQELRDQLQAAQHYVQSVVEQQEATNEELRSANEEIMSSNEELQSSNEELETSKEELQSSNEELSTLNQELQNRNYELAQLTDDLLNLLSSLRIPILMLGGDLIIRRFTPGAARLFNLRPADVGRPLSDIHPAFDMPDLIPLIRNVVADVTPVERELLDRQKKWHLLRVHPYKTTENKIDGAVIMALDIHAVKTVAEKLKEAADYTSAIIEYLLDPLVILDEKLHIESANKAYCDLVGCSTDAIAGKPFHKVHEGLWNDAEMRDKIARVIDQGAIVEDYIIEREFSGAGRKVYSLRARLLKDGIAHPRVILMLANVTSLKRIAERQTYFTDAERSARMEAEQANRTKDHFLAMLSHELRNPLNSVLGWTKVLKLQPELKSEKIQEALDSIESATRTQARMISDLLDISRIASGKIQLELKQVDLHEIVDQAVQLFVPVAKSKKIQIIRHYDGDSVSVLADPERLQQVVSNLLANAVKFTPESGKVEVALNDIDHSVEIAVRDTGPGIPADFEKHMFEPFRQAGGSTTKSGLGLGLAIVKQLVSLHGGSIQASNRSDGSGAEFKVRIPYSDIQFPAFKQEESPRSIANKTESPDLAGLRVLIVDDDPDACAIARRIFEDHKMKVLIALSAHEGLNILKHEKPDVIVSDIGMPDQDGYELMKQIRKLPENQGGKTPAIALTAFARPEDRKQALAVGYQKHLAKPVDPLELLTVIATLTSPRKK